MQAIRNNFMLASPGLQCYKIIMGAKGSKYKSAAADKGKPVLVADDLYRLFQSQ
jgi:hypothetical protein